MRQVGYLQELYEEARSTEHKNYKIRLQQLGAGPYEEKAEAVYILTVVHLRGMSSLYFGSHQVLKGDGWLRNF